MGTIAANDRKTVQYVAASGQTDFAVDFKAYRVGAVFQGVYGELIRGTDDPVTLTLDDFDVIAPTEAGFIARLFTASQDGDLVRFYGRIPSARPREQLPATGYSSVVGEADVEQLFFGYQELRRDVDTLLDQADLEFGAGGGVGAGTWNELGGRPPNLDAFADLAGAADKVPYFTGDAAMALATLTATGRQLIGVASVAAAIALTSPLAAKGDIYTFSNAPARLAVGANGTILTADSGSPAGIKWAAPIGGGGAPAWADLTGVPENVSDFAALVGAANKVAYFTGANSQAVTTLSAFGRSIIGAADAAAVNALLGGGGGGGGGGPFPTLASYGAAEDNATDDKAAFDAFIADAAHKRAWIEGTAYHAGLQRDITKPAMGPGRIRTAAGSWAPADFAWLVAKPAVGAGTDADYYFSGDISKIHGVYRVLGRLTATGNIRKSATESYFESVTTPEFEVLACYSGWSGITAHLNGAIVAGAVLCNVNSAAGIVTGETIGFCNANGDIVETKVVTVAGNQLSWVGGLANGYPDKAKVSHSPRTMNPFRFTQVNMFGGGDAYGHVVRMVGGYAPLASQVHFFETMTIGGIGGDLTLGAAGNYATAEEWLITDAGYDVAAIGVVLDLDRNNDAGARDVVWLGGFIQSFGSKPIDAFASWVGKARVGLDVSRADFTSNSNAAIQLGLGHRIYLNSSATVGGRGYGLSAYGYGPLFSNTPGDMALLSGNDGQDYIRLQYLGAAGVRDARLTIRPTSIQMNVSLLGAKTIEAGLELVTNNGPGGYPAVVFGAGSGSYIWVQAGYIYFKSSAIPMARLALVGYDV